MRSASILRRILRRFCTPREPVGTLILIKITGMEVLSTKCGPTVCYHHPIAACYLILTMLPAVKIEQTAGGGPGVPACKNGGEPLEDDFTSQDRSTMCSCLYRNFFTPNPY